ncbi:MAG: hypothetical protein JWP14_3364 [Frankiales bacterium]|nr:hypothetical protein [Frankiales bacterium]
MPTILLDYSHARPATSAMRRFGAVGVIRYLTRSTSAKRLTQAEARQLRHDGFWVGVVFEDDAARATRGTQAGKADALFAGGQANSIGIPGDCPIFFAVDVDVDPVRVLPYFRAIDETGVGRPIGVYGSQRVVDAVMNAGLATYGWQTVAWSNGRRSPLAHLLQTTEDSVPGTDKNVLLKPIPLWGAPPAAAPDPAPQPTPTPPKELDDMEKILFVPPAGPTVYRVNGKVIPMDSTTGFDNSDVDNLKTLGIPVQQVTKDVLDTAVRMSKAVG